jgi:hypothetical protein
VAVTVRWFIARSCRASHALQATADSLSGSHVPGLKVFGTTALLAGLAILDCPPRFRSRGSRPAEEYGDTMALAFIVAVCSMLRAIFMLCSAQLADLKRLLCLNT